MFRGRRLQDLTLEDVATLLDDVEAEPLDWEAKGVEIKPAEVRKQVCGFANSHDGGYLILGTGVNDGAWELAGVEFPNDDPPVWVTEVAEGVQPRVEGLDTRAFRVEDGRWVTVTWIPPTPTPPYAAFMRAFERIAPIEERVRIPAQRGRPQVAYLGVLLTRGAPASAEKAA
jgi:predicted HTH transcriptional regulator